MRSDALTETLDYLLTHVPPPHAPLHERIGHEQALAAIVRMMDAHARKRLPTVDSSDTDR